MQKRWKMSLMGGMASALILSAAATNSVPNVQAKKENASIQFNSSEFLQHN
ncbi:MULTISPECIES: hypothetical protein [Bacillaceae]|uniref:hypothetical protein n=1 Tax=Bacillaceae TaxID=186817 RepID=UPI003000937B